MNHAKVARVVILANERLKSSMLVVGRAKEERISHNLGLKCFDGTTHMDWQQLEPVFVIEPWGQLIRNFLHSPLNRREMLLESF